MTSDDARRRFAAARVAHLATASAAGRPHVVPFVFAVAGDTIYSAVDHKPKRTTALRRLTNVAENPKVSALADGYDDEDWDRLWWVRADGSATVLDPGSSEGGRAIRLLCARYTQYAKRPPEGPVLSIEIERWSGWEARGPQERVSP
jgi:PPOX class probable F420-dependent enzyme